jgi:peptide/nickel transport system substrate-binding protein
MSGMRSSALLFAGALAATACTGREAPRAAEASGGTIIIASLGEATDVFPPYVNEPNGRIVQDLVFDRLAEIDESLTTVGDKSFAPRLARRWTWAPDSLSIAFELDPRARWHDGRPVTASDVRYSFRVFTDPKAGSPVAPLLGNVDSVSVRDSSTAVVWFKRHTPEQFYDVAYQLVIIPEHVYGSIPMEQLHTSPATRTLVGSGQFRFSKWDPGVQIELLADTSNYRGRPKVDRVILSATTNPATGEAQILTGQADFMEGFPAGDAAKLDSNRYARAVVTPLLQYAFMGMNRYDPKNRNALHPIFSDRRVRRALSMAVDRQAMLRNVFGDRGRLSHGPFPMTLGVADSTLRLPPYDTAAAGALLDSAGWRRGPDGVRSKAGRPLRFSLLSLSTSVPRQRYAVLLQEQFRRLGAQTDIEVVEGGPAFLSRVFAGKFDAVMGGFGTDPSPGGAKQNWTTAGIGPDGQNWLRYSNPTVDALFDSATASFDPAKTKGYASRAYQQIIDDVPAIWLYDVTLIDAVHRRITLAPMRTDEWWANLADWSIPPGKRIDRDRIGLARTKR